MCRLWNVRLVCPSITDPGTVTLQYFPFTSVFDVYLFMRYGLYVICFVVPSHAKLHMYITASNQYNYVTRWTQFLSLTVLVPSYSFSVAINRSRTALHNVWRYDIHLIDWILYIYTACLRGRYFTRGCHVAFSVMNSCTESVCFHVTTEYVYSA